MKQGSSFIDFKLSCELLYNGKCDRCGRNCNYDVIADVLKFFIVVATLVAD